jgi:signal transduction histidine kinase
VQFKYIVEKTFSLVKGEMPSEVSINMKVPEDIEINLDPKRIQQVLINLILNSMQAITDGGSKTINAWEGIENSA